MADCPTPEPGQEWNSWGLLDSFVDGGLGYDRRTVGIGGGQFQLGSHPVDITSRHSMVRPIAGRWTSPSTYHQSVVI